MKHPASYISEHLLVAITLAFIGGIAVAPLLRLSERNLVVFIAALFIALTLLAVLHYSGRSKPLFILLFPVVFAIGSYHGYLHLQIPADENHIYNRILTQTDVVVIGTMSTMAAFDGRTSQVTIDAKAIRHADSAELLPTKGKILLRLQGSWPDELSPGDTLAIRTTLKRPDSFRTPGVFDYARYLAGKNIWITGFIRSPLFLQKVDEDQSLLHTLRYLPERLRTTIGKQIDAAVPPETSGVYRAILIGDRSHVDDDTLESFKGSGTMHILAISGLHMAIIGTLLYAVIFWLLSRSEKLLLRYTLKKWAALFSLPVLLGYGLLAGMNTPVFRALLMSFIVILAICTNRRKSPGALLAFAAMVILMIDPLQLFTVSFLLSFSAITGILFILPILKKLLYPATEATASSSFTSAGKKIVKWIAAGLLVSLVANLATAPIALYSFNRLSTVGPFANLILEPLICLWSLAAGFLSIPFVFLRPEIASFLLQFGGLGLKAAMYTSAFFSSLPHATIWLATPPLWLIAIYYFILIFFVHTGRKNNRRLSFSVLALSVCIVLFIYPPRNFRAEGGDDGDFLHVTYLDVGQGSATLLEYPSGFHLLIDGGGSSFAKTTVGERVIAPFLWSKGILKIDAIAITHPDADHYNGLGFIIEHFSPKTLWIRDRVGHDNDFKRLLLLAKKQGLAVYVPKTGDLLEQDSNSLQCVANTSDWQDNTAFQDRGNNGLILKACATRFCTLFPGDIGRNSERKLVREGFNLHADVLLAAHHGSITSNSSEFLAAVSPKYLFVSAGRSNKGYFPHKGLAKECADQQINLFTTSDQGTLEVIVKRAGYQLYGYKRENNNPLSSYHRLLLSKKPIILQ